MDTIKSFRTIKPLTDETFNKFRALIYRETGISMNDSKKLLVANRLRKRIVALGLEGYEDYYKFLTTTKDGKHEMVHFIDAVSTNETYFFRGENHFKALSGHILPELFKKRNFIKVWSAGCSTGEEPYSIAMTIIESKKKYNWIGNFKIIATDISQEVLKRAKEGVYAGRTLKYVTEPIKKLYFKDLGDGTYAIKDEIKKHVLFTTNNLLKEKPPDKDFDIIFCRNVMIYFDKPTQKNIVDNNFASVLKKDGYLFIGHSESLIGKSEKFRYAHILKAPIYVLRETEQGG